MWAFFGAVSAALLTAIVGNILAQRWQQRNWYAQQRQISHQDEIKSLTDLLGEITNLANTRLFIMKQISQNLDDNTKRFDDLVNQYIDIVKEWNINLPSFYSRITFIMSWGETSFLENSVQKKFFSCGRLIEQAIRLKRSGNPIDNELRKNIRNEIRILNSSVTNILRIMNRILFDRKNIIGYGKKIYYSDGDLAKYSTFDLFKALFARDVLAVYIIRPA